MESVAYPVWTVEAGSGEPRLGEGWRWNFGRSTAAETEMSGVRERVVRTAPEDAGRVVPHSPAGAEMVEQRLRFHSCTLPLNHSSVHPPSSLPHF